MMAAFHFYTEEISVVFAAEALILVKMQVKSL